MIISNNKQKRINTPYQRQNKSISHKLDAKIPFPKFIKADIWVHKQHNKCVLCAV